MKSLDLVIVVSIRGLAGTDESLRLQAWGTVTNLLRPELGKLYRQFNPSNGVWEHKISRPFGVVLGKQEPEVFHRLLAAGEEAQREGNSFVYSYTAEKIGELTFSICADDVQTECRILVQERPELLAQRRCRFLAKNQQYTGEGVHAGK